MAHCISYELRIFSRTFCFGPFMFEMGVNALLFLQGTLRCEPNAEARPWGFPGVVWPIQQKLDFFSWHAGVFISKKYASLLYGFSFQAKPCQLKKLDSLCFSQQLVGSLRLCCLLEARRGLLIKTKANTSLNLPHVVRKGGNLPWHAEGSFCLLNSPQRLHTAP